MIRPLTLAVVLSYSPLPAEDLTVETAPPVVVKSSPVAGTNDVDPAVKEIKVTFSKDMADQSWSWASAFQNSVPQTDGKPRYEDDKRTCVLPVKLQPGKTYAIWVNSPKFNKFKDTDGRSAIPYLLVFKTKG